MASQRELDAQMDLRWSLITRARGPVYERMRVALIDHPAELRLTEEVSQALHALVPEVEAMLSEREDTA